MQEIDTPPAPLTSAERQSLKARAHALEPVVMIGVGGVTDAVAAEVDRALSSHELIKIRMLGDDREARAAAMERICSLTGARPVQQIGKILVVHRPLPPDPESEQEKKSSAPSTRKPRPKPEITPKRILGRAPPRARNSGPGSRTRDGKPARRGR